MTLREMTDLLDRALEIIESAYRTPEWMRYARTERTDKTLEMITKALGPKLPEGAKASNRLNEGNPEYVAYRVPDPKQAKP